MLHIKRTCNWMDALLKASECSGDGRKLTSDLQNRWNDSGEVLHDEMSHFAYGCNMMQEVMMHTYVMAENFRKSAQSDVVTPLFAFYKSAQVRRREVMKEHARVLSNWKNVEEALAKERKDCAKAYSELRAALDLKDKEEDEASLLGKLIKKVASAREACTKKFISFERSWEKAKVLQEHNDQVILPNLLAELEAIERERLYSLMEYTALFGQLFTTWSNDIKVGATTRTCSEDAPAI